MNFHEYASRIGLATAIVMMAPALAQNPAAADSQVRAAVETVTGAIQADAAARGGDMVKITAVVRQQFLPYTDFERTTRLALGKTWNDATPEQRQQLFQQFQSLLVRTYALSLSQLREQNVKFQFQLGRQEAGDAVVKSRVLVNGEEMQIDYRLTRTPNGWKIYDINMMGAWLIEIYRRQFGDVVARDGIDGLLKYLVRHNQVPLG
ncbi:MlaC/ttg2D family ABC transporter substrate-binding protein [Duganella callida]|uniref:ABC transporter substrate-binding protein n=1 Tax=Duganella callida TaxID=2561932 RepID=A0A4Y9SIK8_9BURK|nr:ABC transporter substrate-binding protein [Duganella callida]TFW24721.1 ABC transporter substrate-binding protein [Duganella callida]